MFDINVWFIQNIQKPQFNWYNYNETYFDDIKVWNCNKQILLDLFE